jgi:cystathionine gamma-synthase/methionine-gamma-lyase
MADAPTAGLQRETLTVGAGYHAAEHHGAIKPPLYMTSTFGYRSAQHAKDVHVAYFRKTPAEPVADAAEPDYIYARLDHPNMTMLEARLAALDGAPDAAVFNCGMAAINAILQAFLQSGDAILHTRPVYGGTDALIHGHLQKFGIVPFGIADALDAESIRSAAQAAMAHGRVGLVMVETPANPTSGIADIALIAEIAGEIGAAQGSRPLVVVDNTFLGPFQQNPLRHGADLCMTSLTKYAGGHSDLLAGGVSGASALIHALKQLRTVLGSHLDPHTSWQVLRSLETMHLRTERAGRNARAIAEFLRDHPKIAGVAYVGFQPPGSPAQAVFARQCSGAGSTFSFRIRGGEAEAFRMLDRLRVIHMAVSLGGTETLICHSATTTHFNVPPERRLDVGIDDSALRISVGVEHQDDLIGDLAQALEAI